MSLTKDTQGKSNQMVFHVKTYTNMRPLVPFHEHAHIHAPQNHQISHCMCEKQTNRKAFSSPQILCEQVH